MTRSSSAGQLAKPSRRLGSLVPGRHPSLARHPGSRRPARSGAPGARRLGPVRCALVILALAVAVPAGTQGPGLLVTVGEVSDRAAVVWLRAPAPGPVVLQVAAQAGRPAAARRIGSQATLLTDLTLKLRVDGLAPATRHTYRIEAAGEAAEGEFTTAPPPGAVRPLTLAWSGDLGGAGRCRIPGSGYPIFRAMAERRPEIFLFVGDTVYADQRCGVPENVPGSDFRATDLPGFRAKHRYNRADAAVQSFFRTTAVWAIWDDHEVRNDFAGPTEPLMPTGRRAF